MKRANNLDGKTWLKNSISIWSDVRKSKEERRLKHPAIFPTQLVTRLLDSFTNDDDKVVLDPFCGSGSTVIAADRLGKTGVGIELSEKFVLLARNRLSQRPIWSNGESKVYQANANQLLDYVASNSVDVVVTSPPYWDILIRKRTADNKEISHYEGGVGDLGQIANYKSFIKALREVFECVYKTLKDGKYCIVVVGDVRKDKRFYSLHSDVSTMMQEIGFIYDDLIIWDRRRDYNNMRPLGYPSVFRVNKVHEFILIFKRGSK